MPSMAPTARVWLDIYHNGSDERVFSGTVIGTCGEVFDEGCGDCLVCYPDCEYGQGRFVLYTDWDEDKLRYYIGPLFEFMARRT